MNTEMIASNPRVAEDLGRVAVRRGPVIYCMEELDQPHGVSLSDVSLRVTERSAKQFQNEYASTLLGGVVVLHHDGIAHERPSVDEPLYLPMRAEQPAVHGETLTLIPYYVWANREPTAMQVWTRYTRA
jgi:DUF1680 family protein